MLQNWPASCTALKWNRKLADRTKQIEKLTGKDPRKAVKALGMSRRRIGFSAEVGVIEICNFPIHSAVEFC